MTVMAERPMTSGTGPDNFEELLELLDDLTDKVLTYGKAGVPVYLLLDMQEEQATVFSMPSAKGYESRETKPFGEKVSIPQPFDCVLDTTGFKAP